MGKPFLFFIVLMAISSTSDARVFRLNEQSAGTYIQGVVGPSLLGQTAYNRSDVTFENKVDYNASGEFGLMFLASRTWVRLGVEIIRPQYIEGAQAKNSSEVTLYRVNSNILAWGPVINFEFPLKIYSGARFYFSGGLGYMKVTVKNEYQFTDDGRAIYSVADYAEEASNYSWMSQVGLGFEAGLADSTTFILTTGYRSLIGSSLKQERANPAMGGDINSGDVFRDSNGQDRNLNLSGYWVGLGFRFYWNF